MKVLFSFILCFIFICRASIAQISIMPLLYFQSYDFCAYANPNEGHPYFKKNFSDWGGGSWGVFLKVLPISSKVNLYTGVYNGNLNWGWRISNNNGIFDGTGEFALLYEFPVFVNLLDYKLLFRSKAAIKEDEENGIPPHKRSLHFKTYLGMAAVYIPMDEDNNYFNNSGSLSIPTVGFGKSEYDNVISHTGVSALGAISLYLCNNITNRESLSLSLFYWQGLTNLLSVDVNYAINNTNYHTRLYSRATSLDLVLAYSIPINYKEWFKHKKQKDEQKE